MQLSTQAARLGLAALVALAAGCDSSDPTTSTAAGPTVQFASNGANVAEGNNARITVELVNRPAGQTGPITVEVLFARGASTATTGADFSGFGETAEGVLRATVTFDGTDEDAARAGEQRVVQFPVAADNVAESAEAAVFALQRVTGGAQIGSVREFTLTIGVPPISAVRAQAQGQTVTIEGVVTRARGRFIYVQDGTTAITVFASTSATFPQSTALNTAVANGSVAPGDRIQVVGRLTEFRTLLQVDQVAGFSVLARGGAAAVPAAQAATVAQVNGSGETYESELVRLTGITIDPAGDVVFAAAKSYTARDASGTSFVLRVPGAGESEVIGRTIPAGAATVTGVVSQFDGVYQVLVINTTDVQ